MQTMPSVARVFPLVVSAILAFLSGAGTATAQDFPTKPIKLVVPTAVGSTTDLIARSLIPEMSKYLRQSIVPDYKVGAGNIIGFEYAAKQAPDGYTMLIITVSQLALAPVTVKDLRFDALKDLPPVIGFGESRAYLSAPVRLPVKTFQEFVQYAKSNPGKLSFFSAGASQQLPIEAIKQRLGLDILHVPYKASTAGHLAIATGEVDLGMSNEASIIAFGGKLKILAVSGAKRQPKFPDVPTFAEIGFPEIPGYSYSLNVPRGTPGHVVEKLYLAASQASRNPEVITQMNNLQIEMVDQRPEVAARDLAAMGKYFAELAPKVGMLPQ